MLSIRDAIYLAAIAVMGLFWFADRSLIADQLRYTRVALKTEQSQNEATKRRLWAAGPSKLDRRFGPRVESSE